MGAASAHLAKTDLAELAVKLPALAETTKAAQHVIGKGRAGRPEDEAMHYLLHSAFQVRTAILRRPFKLDWAGEPESITDASRFCVRIAHVVDSKLPLGRIANASRSVRQKSMAVSGLGVTPEIMEHYCKQFG